jgi:type I restriction enzyme S subunit
MHLAEFVNGNAYKPADFDDAGFPVVRIKQLLDDEADFDLASVPERPVWLSDGDLVFSWSATLAVRFWTRGKALLNQHLFRVDVHPSVERRWFAYVLEEGVRRLEPLMHGSAMTHITHDMLRSLTVALPPRATQRAIAGYLDAETARIDALIEKKQRMIALLDERDITLIHELTSRGLRNAETAASGVAWLGEAPNHWQVMQLRRLCSVRRGASPRPIDDPIYFDDSGEYAWVRISDVTEAERYLTTTTQRLSTLGSSLSVKLLPGSLFVSIAGSVGKPIITKIKCCIHDGFVYFVNLRMRPAYLYYLFRASQVFQGLGKLGTQLNLNTETIGGMTIPVPPLDEQDEIATALDRRLAHSGRTRKALIRQIALLEEHRQALITAAVTGEREIAEAT